VPESIRASALLLAMSSFLAVIFAPACEELYFRGFVFPGLARAWGPAAGIVASGLLFGSAHLLGNPTLYKSMIQFTAIGMVFAFAYWKSGNILSTMLAHFTFNLIGIVTIASTTC
jgi:membrane protease YdiL (CAAX protease family)